MRNEKSYHRVGFIIRYLKGKEEITGYSYEPWHIRYVGEIATEICEQQLTLEEYVNGGIMDSFIRACFNIMLILSTKCSVGNIFHAVFCAKPKINLIKFTATWLQRTIY